MNICLNSFLSSAISIFPKAVTQKRVLVIAAIAFSCFSAFLILRRCLFNARKGKEIPLRLEKSERVFGAQFSHPLAQQMSQAIENINTQGLQNLIQSVSQQELQDALKAEETKKGVNLLSLAAYLDNFEAVDLISSSTEEPLLKEILIQQDKCEWTAFHHLVLMKDKGLRYKTLKKKVNIDTKTIGKFYCESASMLRKYVRSQTKKFSGKCQKADATFKLYFREGKPGQRIEHHLTFEDFKIKFGSMLTAKPKNFKVIPHLNADFVRSRWFEMQKIARDERKLQMIDQHLQEIYQKGEEDGLAVAKMEYTDRGEKIPDNIHLGVGVEARRQFKCGQLIALYGGEHFENGKYPRNRSGAYNYGCISQKETISGLRFRSYGSTFLHSAPNAKFSEAENILGISYLFMEAIAEINEGEYICENYGEAYFNSMGIDPFEVRPKAREEMENNPPADPMLRARQKNYLAIKANVPKKPR